MHRSLMWKVVLEFLVVEIHDIAWFLLEEIKTLLLLPKDELRSRLVTQKLILERKKEEMEVQLTLLAGMIDQLE